MKLFKIFPFFDRTVGKWATEARLLRWLTFLWLFVGLAVLFSASYAVARAGTTDGLYYVKMQLGWVVLGLLLFNAVIHFPLRMLAKIGSICLFIVLILLFATHIPGVGTTRNEATRWISVAGIPVQPSELIKPFLVLQAAQLFGHWSRISPLRRTMWLGVFLLALLGILLQPSLSVTALCGLTLWLIALAAGLPMYQMLGTGALGIVAGVASVSINRYQLVRIMSFLDPWPDQAGSGYQLTQGLMAIGSGGVWGKGFGFSEMKHFLPYQDTDFIFAIFAEEFGLVGSISIIVLLLIFAGVGLIVSSKCKDPFVRLVALGATVLLVGQSFLNIGVSAGVLPTTGLPFPFFSYGGSSMLSSLFVAGMLIRAAREMSAAEVLPFKRSSSTDPKDFRAQRQEKLAASKRRRSFSVK
ncbi:FtsW/RodA/SpoVE family cell cycle protein [Tumidithrix helvetica PCC 7403]|uniref:FtsW/RodA/SpoVE family cell cycle protein n=1 Tax=Tumidithrix helvetica TaxID=3457545 RepID=UPI003C8EB759